MNDLIANAHAVYTTVSTSALGHVLLGALLLFGCWLAVPFLTRLVRAGLERSLLVIRPEGSHLVSPITSTVRGLLTLLAMGLVLSHFGLRMSMSGALVELQQVADGAIALVPLLLGIVVIGAAAWTVARLARRASGAGLSSVERRLAELELPAPVAAIGATFVFWSTFLGLSVAALGFLDVGSLGPSAASLVGGLQAHLFGAITATGILVVTSVVAGIGVRWIMRTLRDLSAETFAEEIGAGDLFGESFTFTRAIGGSVFFFAILAGAASAVSVLDIAAVTDTFAKVTAVGGTIVLGTLYLGVGLYLGALAHRKIAERGDALVANIARFSIVGLVLATGLAPLGLGASAMGSVLAISVGGVAIAAVIAAAIGGGVRRAVAVDVARLEGHPYRSVNRG